MTTLQITIDCTDPTAMVAFWAVALDYVPAPPPDGFASWLAWYRSIGVPDEELEGLTDDDNDRLVDPTGVGPLVWFQQVPEPKTVKNRLHLDLRVTGGRAVPVAERKPVVRAKVAQLVALGATVVHEHDEAVEGHYAVTLQDPEGNELCVV